MLKVFRCGCARLGASKALHSDAVVEVPQPEGMMETRVHIHVLNAITASVLIEGKQGEKQ